MDVIAPPELDITAGEEAGPVSFEATVEIRPDVIVAGYQGLRVEVPSPDVTDEEIDEQIDRLRSQYGELSTVDRPAVEQDYVTVDISGTQNGEEVDGLTADDYSYLVGSGMIATEFDQHLTGAKVGDILEFDADHPDPDEDPVHFRVLVKEVKERVLPDLTDEWVADASEFETVEELQGRDPVQPGPEPRGADPGLGAGAGRCRARQAGRRRAARVDGQLRDPDASPEPPHAAPEPRHRARGLPADHRS